MADILTLPEARRAIRLPDNDQSRDTDLVETYIPAVTAVIEDLIGPVMAGTTRTFVADGGGALVMLPWLNITSVDSVDDSGTTLTVDDYQVNLGTGIVYRGTADLPRTFATGRQSVTITYTAGTYATPAAVPYNIKLAARIILAHLWQADQQGYRPDFGGPDNSVTPSSSGYAIPRRAVELLGSSSNRPLGVA